MKQTITEHPESLIRSESMQIHTGALEGERREFTNRCILRRKCSVTDASIVYASVLSAWTPSPRRQ
jgi:hypothetical protein